MLKNEQLLIGLLSFAFGINAFQSRSQLARATMKATRSVGIHFYHHDPLLQRLSSKLLCMSQSSIEDRNITWESSWLDIDQLDELAKVTLVSIEEIEANHVDVTYYDQSLEKSFFHIRQSSIKGYDSKTFISETFSWDEFQEKKKSKDSFLRNSCSTNLRHVNEAAIKTYNWCSEFVQRLNLCPWAKQSLLSTNAMRIKALHENCGWDLMEQLVKESSMELKSLTDDGVVDPYIGITFVIVIPSSNDDEHFMDPFNFLTFYDNFNYLEEEFMDDKDNNGFGEVTIAPFHPEWTFASSMDDDDNDEELDLDRQETLQQKDPLDYEKRTPYPTISIVMAKGIDLAGEEATAKIGIHNEEILNELGYDKVKNMYLENVLSKTFSSFL